MTHRVFAILALLSALVIVNPMTASAHPRGGASGLIVAERYSDQNNGNPQLVAVRPDAGAVSVLTSGHSDTVPDLSPSGRFVVFERCVNSQDCDEVGKINIWVMRADGGAAHPLTHCDGSHCLGAFDPAFSPDGREIAFAEDLLDAKGTNFQGIFVMRADGTGANRLTSRSEGEPPDGHPSFSPDGRRIVFAREVEGGGARLMIINADGTGLRELLPGVDAFDPHWSPDGRHVAFTLVLHHGDQDTVDVATVRPDGRRLRLLTHETAGVSAAFQPDYSPKGHDIVFTENGAAGCHLVIINRNGHHRRQLQTGDRCLLHSSFGSDPSRIDR